MEIPLIPTYRVYRLYDTLHNCSYCSIYTSITYRLHSLFLLLPSSHLFHFPSSLTPHSSPSLLSSPHLSLLYFHPFLLFPFLSFSLHYTPCLYHPLISPFFSGPLLYHCSSTDPGLTGSSDPFLSTPFPYSGVDFCSEHLWTGWTCPITLADCVAVLTLQLIRLAVHLWRYAQQYSGKQLFPSYLNQLFCFMQFTSNNLNNYIRYNIL